MKRKRIFENSTPLLQQGEVTEGEERLHFGVVTSVYTLEGKIDVLIDGSKQRGSIEAINLLFPGLGPDHGFRIMPRKGDFVLLYASENQVYYLGTLGLRYYDKILDLDKPIDDPNGVLTHLLEGEGALEGFGNIIASLKQGVVLQAGSIDLIRTFLTKFNQIKTDGFHFLDRTKYRRSRVVFGMPLRYDPESTVQEDAYVENHDYDEYYRVLNSPIVAGVVDDISLPFYEKHIAPFLMDKNTPPASSKEIESENLRTKEKLIWFEKISHTPLIGSPTYEVLPSPNISRNAEHTHEIGESGSFNKKFEFNQLGVLKTSVEIDVTDKGDVKFEVINDHPQQTKSLKVDYQEDGSLTVEIQGGTSTKLQITFDPMTGKTEINTTHSSGGNSIVLGDTSSTTGTPGVDINSGKQLVTVDLLAEILVPFLQEYAAHVNPPNGPSPTAGPAAAQLLAKINSSKVPGADTLLTETFKAK